MATLATNPWIGFPLAEPAHSMEEQNLKPGKPTIPSSWTSYITSGLHTSSRPKSCEFTCTRNLNKEPKQ